jgi:DNA-binding XRE family transcriptional regulator
MDAAIAKARAAMTNYIYRDFTMTAACYTVGLYCTRRLVGGRKRPPDSGRRCTPRAPPEWRLSITSAEFRMARKALGLSQTDMANALRLKDARAVRYYEAGERDISGPIQVAIAYMLKFGLPPDMWPLG